MPSSELKPLKSGFPKRLSSLDPQQLQDLEYLIQFRVAEAVEAERENMKGNIATAVAACEARMLLAFPDSDAVGHKRFHEQEIENNKERKALMKDIRHKAIIGFIWLFVGLGSTAFWEYIKREVHK